jgi:putative oxidoreductase
VKKAAPRAAFFVSGRFPARNPPPCSSLLHSMPQEDTMDIDRIAAQSQPYLLSLFRFITGLLLFHYGVAKLFKYPPVELFADVTPLSLWGVAGMIEFVLGGLLMLGLFTRFVAFIFSGEMAFAYFTEHLPQSFFPLVNDGALAIMFCFSCLYLAATGGGPISVDAMRRA